MGGGPDGLNIKRKENSDSETKLLMRRMGVVWVYSETNLQMGVVYVV